jgi:hypothetical protein
MKWSPAAPMGGERGGENNYSNSQPQINNGLELSSDNLFGHPHNLEENLFNKKSAEGL